MTDYGTPVTPQEACIRIEESIGYKVEQLRLEAQILLRQADAWAEASRLVSAERMRYERHQPVDSGRTETPTETSENGSEGADQ